MFDYAINNETMIGHNLPPFPTNNPNIRGIKAMAKSIITIKTHKKQTKKKINTKIGDKYGRLTVIKMIEPHITPKGQKYKRVLCKCECGAETETWLSSLRRGHTVSCGCKKKELFIDRATKHGLRSHPLYHIWINMKERCGNSNRPDFKDYGGRGITVWEGWRYGPSPFIKWAEKNGWKKGLYLDQEDVDGNYEPSNCRFVDSGLNARNTRLLNVTNTSGFRGVSQSGRKWVAAIRCENKIFNLGAFETKIEAAKAYDMAAINLNAEHPLNFGKGR